MESHQNGDSFLVAWTSTSVRESQLEWKFVSNQCHKFWNVSYVFREFLQNTCSHEKLTNVILWWLTIRLKADAFSQCRIGRAIRWLWVEVVGTNRESYSWGRMCDDSSLRENLMERLVKLYCHEGFLLRILWFFFWVNATLAT